MFYFADTLMSDLKASRQEYEITPILPDESYVVSRSKDTFKIRCTVSTVEDWNTWLEEFQRLSNTSWIVSRSVTNQETIDLSRDYACQHSSYRKASSSKKDCSCTAVLKIRIKVERKNSDNYTKVFFLPNITIIHFTPE